MGTARWMLIATCLLGAAACGREPASGPSAHGHDASHCDTCTKAKADPKGGWCDRCQVGYVAGVETACRACAEGAGCTPHPK